MLNRKAPIGPCSGNLLKTMNSNMKSTRSITQIRMPIWRKTNNIKKAIGNRIILNLHLKRFNPVNQIKILLPKKNLK